VMMDLLPAARVYINAAVCGRTPRYAVVRLVVVERRSSLIMIVSLAPFRFTPPQ
jgi:hypothetical protein